MKVTITTATVTIGIKTVNLTKSIVRQLPYVPSTLKADWTRQSVFGIGCVILDNETLYLVQTPDGLHKTNSSLAGITMPNRIVLL